MQLNAPLIVNGYNRALTHTHIIGALSLKCMFNGHAMYTVGRSHVVVDHQRYLILNHAQPYDLLIEAVDPVESFCVFFPHAWQTDVLRNITLPDETLLENPYDTAQSSPLFFEIPHDHDDIVSPILFRIRTRYQSGESLPDSWLYKLLVRIIVMQLGVYQQARSFPGARPATRQELYRRLHQVIAFLHAHIERTLTLDDMAQVAYMSPYHFLRRFTEAFRITPHAYLTQLRLERAETMLRQSDLPVTEICMAVGFQSLSSFSTLFRRWYGMSPRAFRQQLRACAK